MKIFKFIPILSLLVLSHLALAHTHLKHSVPKYGAELNMPPEDLYLEFTSPVTLVRLQLTDHSGKTIKLNAKTSEGLNDIFRITLPVLASGTYNVKWIVMGKDAHKMEGDFPFTVNASAMTHEPASSDSHNPE